MLGSERVLQSRCGKRESKVRFKQLQYENQNLCEMDSLPWPQSIIFTFTDKIYNYRLVDFQFFLAAIVRVLKILIISSFACDVTSLCLEKSVKNWENSRTEGWIRRGKMHTKRLRTNSECFLRGVVVPG